MLLELSQTQTQAAWETILTCIFEIRKQDWTECVDRMAGCNRSWVDTASEETDNGL